MPLVLSLKENQDFYAGAERFVIGRMRGPTSFQVRRSSDSRIFEIDDSRAVQVAEDVYVSAGRPRLPQVATVVIDAPPSILILRGSKASGKASPTKGAS